MGNILKKTTRRTFIKQGSTFAAGIGMVPYMNFGKIGVADPVKRQFGKIGFEVTSFGLGGQASLQWTPSDIDPVKIILKSFDQKVNYYDTSNLYGPSQANFGKAFQELSLKPGVAGYNETLRKNIFLTTKTHLRWAKGNPKIQGVSNWSNGDVAGGTVSDIKRSLSQMFGDGMGNYPKGAYLDMVLIHNLNTTQEVDALYTGLKNTSADMETIGALAALRDYRDGSNLTGLNPDEEKLINHIGFSGHFSAPVMMDMIQRDDEDILEAMLVAINANDKLKFNMQHNVIPVAAAKNMGIIGMKVFADGAMYTKKATWSNLPEHVVRSVGSSDLPSRPLVEYALTTNGINTAIMGIGEISDNPKKCQLIQNISAAQISENGLEEVDRERVEGVAVHAKEGNTNYFQRDAEPLSAPGNVTASKEKVSGKRQVGLSWDSAYAGKNPIDHYEIYRDNEMVAKIPHIPQVSKTPFNWMDSKSGKGNNYKVVTVDSNGSKAASGEIKA